jgi:hypothetical protein
MIAVPRLVIVCKQSFVFCVRLFQLNFIVLRLFREYKKYFEFIFIFILYLYIY